MATSRIGIVMIRRAPAAAQQQLDKFSRMEKEVSMLFDRLFAPSHPFRPVAEGGWHPFTDIYETDRHVIVRMELAGIDPDKLEVAKEGRCLIVRGERHDPLAASARACHQIEISHGFFERVVCLPVDFREETVKAEYGAQSGFLLISIDKLEAP